jgi:hypothetical protein
MNDSLCFLCVQAFQEALNTPIGQSFTSAFSSFNPALPDDLNILVCLDRLFSNPYSSPRDFLDDLSEQTAKVVRHFGQESDLAIAILTVHQLTEDNLRPVFPSDGSTWRAALLELSQSLSSAISQIPDEMKSWRVPPARRLNVSRADPPKSAPIKYPKVDLAELKSMILRLPSDEDVRHVGQIISRHQPEYSHSEGVVNFDLKICEPYTLHLVHEFVKTRCPPISPHQPLFGVAQLPRVKSTTLPPTVLGSPMPVGDVGDATLAQARLLALSLADPAAIAAAATTSPFFAVQSPVRQRSVTFAEVRKEKPDE